MTIIAYETIWYPGVYTPKMEGDYSRLVADLSVEAITTLVQQRAKQDGEWTLKKGLVAENQAKMQRMIEWVSNPRHIEQCLSHIRTEKQENTRTVDWVCRELAKASKVSVK